MTDLTASVDNLEPQDIDYLFDGPKQNAFDAIGKSPDDAARAVQLSKATGTPPNVVYGDLDNFERQTQAKLSAEIINQNRHIRDFLTDPIAAKLTNDDLANLDNFTQQIEKHRKTDPIYQGVQGFLSAFEDVGKPSSSLSEQELREHPLASSIISGLGDLGEIIVGVPMGAMIGATRFAQALVTHAGVDPEHAGRIGDQVVQTIGDPGMWASLGPVLGTLGVPIGASAHNESIRAAIVKAGPWLQEGKIPPLGIDPHIDSLHADVAKSDAEGLREMMKAMSATNLRERSPEYAKRFADQIVEGEIGLSADKVRELYGEKVPEEGDGKLGFIPDLQEKLRVAEATGSDIQVGLSDYLANVDPTVAKELEDFVRFREGGVTLEEAKNLETEEKPTVEQPTPVQVLRSAGGLDPLIKDRKLSLQRMDEGPGPEEGSGVSYNVVDQEGKTVANLDLGIEKGGKRLYVDDIRGVGGAGPGSIGPRMMRDLLTQLKAEFPLAEELTGFRVSGARDKAGTYESHGKVSIKLDALGDEASLNALIDHIDREAAWEDVGGGYEAFFEPKENYNKNEQTLVDEVNRALNRIVPKQADVQEAQVVRSPRGDQLGGLHITSENVRPLIIWSLSADNPMRAARHEALHHLRQQGFFNREEWSTLMHAAMEEGWVEKYGIQEHYPNEKPAAQIEEAIAEAFGNWRRDQGEKGVLRKGLEKVLGEPAVTKVFEKLQKLLDTIKQGIDRVFGKDVGWEDLFERADSGVIGSREGNAPLGKNAFRESKDQLELPQAGTTRMEDRDAFAQASAMGLTVQEYQKLMKLIEKRSQEDAEYLTKKYTEEARRRQSEKWKADANAMRPEVVDAMKRDPTFATDLWFRDGELDGQKQTKPKFAKEFLTDEQKAQIPEHFQSDSGMHPDDIATLLGFQSGKELIDTMTAYDAALKASGKRPAEFRRQLIEQELSRQMEARYGKLQENVLQEAMEHVLSDTQIEMLHEETLGFATRAGLEFSIKKEEYLAALKDEFQNLPAKDVASTRFIADTGRANREAFRAAVSQDWAEAFRQKQRAYNATIFAKEALAFEKGVAKKTENLVDKYSKREVKGTRPEYTNAIHMILEKFGQKIGRRPQDLAAEVEGSGYKSLDDFIQTKQNEYETVQLEIPVADWIRQDGPTKSFEQITVQDVQDIHDAIASLDYLGRTEDKLEKLGAKEEKARVVGAMNAQLEGKFAATPLEEKSLATRFLRQAIAATHAVETIFRRFDGRDPEGLFTKTFIYPGARAMNEESGLQRQLSQRYRDLGVIKDPKQAVEHAFDDPVFGGRRNITRATLDNIIANVGNKYNRDRTAYTLGLMTVDATGKSVPDAGALMRWLETVTKPEDITRAQKRGEQIWSWLKGMEDNVYRGLYGIAPENIPLDGFTMHGATYEGWYHPIIIDKERSIRAGKFERDPVTKPTNFWPTVKNDYTKRRTGSIDYLDFKPGMPELTMAQMVHDIALREYVNDASKLILDNDFRIGITKTYGKEYHDLIKTWLYNVAGNRSFNEGAISTAARVSNFFRQNVISTYIAFNIAGTMFKHAPTAAVMSAREVGLGKFLKGSFDTYLGKTVDHVEYAQNLQNFLGKDPALGESIWGFTHRYSEEIQRRDRNYMDTLSGAHDIIFGKPTLRNRIMQWGAKAVALSDMASAVPLWYTKYNDVVAKTGDHPTAVQQADLAVRNAHGSTSEMSRPLIASNNSALAPWFTSLYGFFGANMQRKIEIMHDVNDAYKLGKAREIGQAAKMVPGIIASTLAYVVAPVAVEEAVTSQFTDDRRGFGTKALNWTLMGLSNSIIGLRDFAWGLEHGQEPSAGLITSPLKDFANLGRDLGKVRPFSKDKAGKIVQDGLTAFGDVTGMMPKPVARAARFGIDIANRQQHPKTPGDWWRGVMSGKTDRHIER